jgi:hypothetical protein
MRLAGERVGGGGAGSPAGAFWAPLGFGTFVATPQMNGSLNRRRYLFSWSGSLRGKEERHAMLKALRVGDDLGFVV